MLKLQRERERERRASVRELVLNARLPKGGLRHRPKRSRLIKGVAYGDL